METIEVEEAFVGLACATRLWWSEVVRVQLAEYLSKQGKHEQRFLQKLKYYAQAGFRRFEGGEGFPIKHELRQVYRIGDGHLFRIAGFYETESKTSFIALDAFSKRGQKNSRMDRDRYAGVADIRDLGHWKKKGASDGNYPRLASDS